MIDIATLGISEEKPRNIKKFLTINQYRQIAKRLIFKIAPIYGAGVAKELMRSEDVISNVATQVMIADWQWNGKGTLFGYRKQRAIWAIQNTVQRNKKNIYSLNFIVKTGEQQGIELGDLIEDKKFFHEDSLQNKEDKELVNKILTSEIISDRQKECLKLRFYGDMTLQQVGDTLGITKEAVRKSIQRAKRKIRGAYEKNYTT